MKQVDVLPNINWLPLPITNAIAICIALIYFFDAMKLFCVSQAIKLLLSKTCIFTDNTFRKKKLQVSKTVFLSLSMENSRKSSISYSKFYLHFTASLAESNAYKCTQEIKIHALTLFYFLLFVFRSCRFVWLNQKSL